MAGGSSHTPKKACTHFLFCVPLLQVHFWFIQWQHQGMLVQVCRARPGSWAAITVLPKVCPPQPKTLGCPRGCNTNCVVRGWWVGVLEGSSLGAAIQTSLIDVWPKKVDCSTAPEN